jgi:hypothetical protein
MLAKRRLATIMGEIVEKVAKSGEKWGEMWITVEISLAKALPAQPIIGKPQAIGSKQNQPCSSEDLNIL